MRRLRLKADGRIVELRDGQEFPLAPVMAPAALATASVASGTFVTTITDVVGFFSFLGIATLWFGLK